MSTFGLVLLGLALAVGVILLIAARKPDTFRIERRATFAAPPDLVFNQINDLVAWQAWSPWAKKDPDAKAEFGAITAGPGATFRWDGDKNVGRGQMTILESEAPRRVLMRLDFEAPFKATNQAEFTIVPTGTGSELVWAMFGPQPLLSRVMCLFFDMDKMVGKDFEAGLANLRAIVEAKSG